MIRCDYFRRGIFAIAHDGMAMRVSFVPMIISCMGGISNDNKQKATDSDTDFFHIVLLFKQL